MNFNDLGLEPELLSAIDAHGYSTPTPIQVGAIPPVLAGRDLLAGAQTGHRQDRGLRAAPAAAAGRRRRPRAARARARPDPRARGADPREHPRLRREQEAARPRDLRRRRRAAADQRPACRLRHPRRDARPACSTSRTAGSRTCPEVRHLVLDEADRMLDMGFIHDIRRIIKLLPAKRQNLMFSATYTPDIRSLASRILVNPVQVEVTPPNSTVERVTQLAFRVRKDDKRHLLVHLFENGANGEGRWHQALVFTRTKHGANRLSRAARARRHPLRGHPRQQEPGRAHARARGLQGGQADGAGRDRGRLARPRHPRAAAGRQLRPAARARGLRASHRPHGARRQRRPRGVAGVGRRGAAAARHRADDAPVRAVLADARVRAHGTGAGRAAGRSRRAGASAAPARAHPDPAIPAPPRFG